MKAMKHYENDHVHVYIRDGEWRGWLTFMSEKQMRQVGECLKDLARTGGNEIEIK